MPPRPEDDIGSLEKARERLYTPDAGAGIRSTFPAREDRSLPHQWEQELLEHVPSKGKRHLRLASIFFFTALGFFLLALAAAGYFFYFGGNSVSVDKISIDIQGPTTVAGGDIVPLSLSITNRNPVSLEDARIEIGFPAGSLAADDSLTPYPRYTEDLGEIRSGETITRSIKAIVFGGAGETLTVPVSLSYGTRNSSTEFVKKESYPLAISSTPLSIALESLTETVSGKPLTFAATVRSNATVPIGNVVVQGTFPFGFDVISSSQKMNGSTFFLGTLEPGQSKTVTLTGRLIGENREQRVFHFTVGTVKAPTDQTPALSYMTQDATITIMAPFIATTLAINGNTNPSIVITPGKLHNVSVSYTNTLPTSVTNATVAVTLTGSAVDYDSIKTTNGFYRSSDRTVVFSRDTDPSLATLAPGAFGIGTFSFSTVPADALPSSPNVTFTTSVSGTRVGQANVPENVSATAAKTVKVATAITLQATALHSSGPFANTGPIPPVADQATTYTIQWNLVSQGSAVAGGIVTATLPQYISYTGKTSGTGTFTYDEKSGTVSWNTGDLPQGGKAEGAFQVSLLPSSSQRGGAPALTSGASFTGYDRFAGVQVTANADFVTTETKADPGYSSEDAVVQ